MYLMSFPYTIQMKTKNIINCKQSPTMSIKLTAYGKMLVNSGCISFYNHFSLNSLSGKASYVYKRFFQKITFIIVALATWALWKYKSELKKALFLNSEIKRRKNKRTRWAELYDPVSVKCMKWPDPLHVKVFLPRFVLRKLWVEYSLKQEPAAMQWERCKQPAWSPHENIEQDNRLRGTGPLKKLEEIQRRK